MAGSNDEPTRRKIFSWIKAHQDTFYEPRLPIAPVGVYFSPETRNYFAADFIPSYRGILILLMQRHLEFQIVTPRTLADFHGAALVLPDVRLVSEAERLQFKKYAGDGGKLVVTGSGLPELGAGPSVMRFGSCPGKEYYAALLKDVATAKSGQEVEFLAALKSDAPVHVNGSAMMATSMAQVGAKPHVFFANFAGLQGSVNPIQTVQNDVQVVVSGSSKGRGFFLPFLGEVQELKGSTAAGEETYKLPPIEKGGVFWVEP